MPASKPTGRPRRFAPLENLPTPQELRELAKGLPREAWQQVTWRAGSKGPQRSRFAKIQVWAAHGWKRQLHPDRVAEWLLIEWPAGESQPVKYWLAQLDSPVPGVRRLVRIAHARWRIELDYRELKE